MNIFSGVYCIENKINGKIYIGSSSNIKLRLRDHVIRLKGNYHDNEYLQNAFNKYGEQNFTFFTLELCEDYLVIEQCYLDTLLFAQEYIASNGKDKRFKKLGYNIDPIAGNTGKMTTDEQRERHKKSIASSKTHLSKLRKKSILAYDRTTGEFKKECDSVISMAKWIGVARQHLKQVLKGKKRYVHNLVVKYKESDNYPLIIEPVTQYKNQEGRRLAMKKVHDNNSKKIFQYDLNSNFIKEHFNAVQAAASLGVGKYPSNITSCARERVVTAYGFTWKYDRK